MKRLISIAAALCLLLTMLPLSVWAKPASESRMPERPVQIKPQKGIETEDRSKNSNVKDSEIALKVRISESLIFSHLKEE